MAQAKERPGPDRRANAHRRLRSVAVAVTGCLLLSACAALSPDAGMGGVRDMVGETLGRDVIAIRSPEDHAAARAVIDRVRKRPLTAEAAVQIALLNNRGLQAGYNELGIAEATWLEASLPPNPRFSVERLASAGTVELEARIVGNILALATLPERAEIATDRFRQAQLRAAEKTLRIAAETRRAYYRAVATRQAVSFLSQANETAETATKLARRLGESGAMNKLDQAREQAFHAETTGDLARARQGASSAREALIRMLGFWGADLDLQLPSALPPLPRRPQTLPFVEVEALRRRADVRVARIEVEALAKSYALTETTRFLNLLEVAGIAKATKDRAPESVSMSGASS